jgi:hypothetical protein
MTSTKVFSAIARNLCISSTSQSNNDNQSYVTFYPQGYPHNRRNVDVLDAPPGGRASRRPEVTRIPNPHHPLTQESYESR